VFNPQLSFVCLIVGLFAFAMAWSAVKRARAVALFFEVGSWAAVLRVLRREWGRLRVPGRQTLRRWARDFREQGSVLGAQRRQRRLRTPPAVLTRVRRAITRNPHLSVRQLSRRMGQSRSTIQRVLRQQLRLHPYKLQLTQRLRRGDKAKRQRFCRWVVGKWANPSFRKHLLVSDEAHFYPNGLFNKQNCRVWGDDNPHAAVQSDQQSPYVTVWCGLSTRRIIGQYFFQSGGRTETVTGARYREMLDSFLIPELQRLHIPLHPSGSSRTGRRPTQHEGYWTGWKKFSPVK